MKEFKGTRAPWAVRINGSNSIPILDVDGYEVASTYNDDEYSTEIDRHNAYLIAAAPELLSVCQELMRFISGTKDHVSSDSLAKMTNQAIAKALGETPIQTP